MSTSRTLISTGGECLQRALTAFQAHVLSVGNKKCSYLKEPLSFLFSAIATWYLVKKGWKPTGILCWWKTLQQVGKPPIPSSNLEAAKSAGVQGEAQSPRRFGRFLPSPDPGKHCRLEIWAWPFLQEGSFSVYTWPILMKWEWKGNTNDSGWQFLCSHFHNGLWLPCKLGSTQPDAVLFLIPNSPLCRLCVRNPPERGRWERWWVSCATWSPHNLLRVAGCQQHRSPLASGAGRAWSCVSSSAAPHPNLGVVMWEECGTGAGHGPISLNGLCVIA